MVRSCGESGTSWIGALQSWFCWSTTGLRYKMPAYGLRTCAYARVQVHRMGKGADASYMHPAASKIRKFMHNSLGVSTLGPCKYGSTVVVTATVVQMKAFHYSDCPLLLHLFFFPPVYARPGQLDMIRHYQIQRRLCHESLVLSRPSLIHQSQTSRLSFFSSPTVFPTVEHYAFLNHDSCQIRHSRSRRSTPRTFPDPLSYCDTYPLIYIFSFCPALVSISFQAFEHHPSLARGQ